MLDSLRGLLALYILLGHARWLLWTGYSEWRRHPHETWEQVLAFVSGGLRYGHEACLVFLVLSGFFIHRHPAQKLSAGENPSLDVGNYLKRRVRRLWPPYASALLLTVVLDYTGRHLFPTLYLAQTGDPLLDANFTSKVYTPASVLPALFLLPGIFGQDFGTNGPLWLLGYFTVYYLLYPLWLALRRQSAVAAYIVVSIVCLVLGLFSSLGWFGTVLSKYPIWLSGAALVEIIAGSRRIRAEPIRFRVWSLVAFAVFSLAYGPLEGVPIARVLAAAGYGAAMTAFFATSAEGSPLGGLFRVLQFFGLRSYSIYIVHFPVLALLSAWAIERNGGRPLHGWLALCGTITAVIVSIFWHHICERPFCTRIRQFQSEAASNKVE